MNAASARLALLALALCSAPTLAQVPLPTSPHCPLSMGSTDAMKSHTLYLYFPAKDDPDYSGTASSPNPDFASQGIHPVKAFDAATLSPALSGNTAALIDRVHTVVADDYCEFNVQVQNTSTDPDPGHNGTTKGLVPNRNTVAIGADATGLQGKVHLWGQAESQGVLQNPGFSRVWAGYYGICEGTPCTTGLLTNTGSATSNTTPTTSKLLDRWGQAIGGTAAHEAGHSYGLAHPDDNPQWDHDEPGNAAPLAGEDDFHHHLMPSGNNLTAPDRIGYRRHFSDTTYGILATNIGLSIQTMHNWDLVNPNQQQAQSLSIFFLATPQQAVNIAWTYDGAESPWIKPQVELVVPDQNVKGGQQMPAGKPQACPPQPAAECQAYYPQNSSVLWNVYRITWSVPNPNYNGSAGVISGGGRFHVGATFTGVDFNQPDPIIIWGATLYDDMGNPLKLHPRLPMYDTGSTDGSDGYSLNLYTPPQGPPLQIQGMRIYQLPRVASIESMIGSGHPRSFDGLPITPWRTVTCRAGSLADGRHCVFAHKDDEPHIRVERHLGEPGVVDCSTHVPLWRLRRILPFLRLPRVRVPPPHAGAPDAAGSPDLDGRICAGSQRDPFPSTTVYMIGTFVDPHAKHWVPALRHYVYGPVVTRVFYQFAGVRQPDKLWNPEPPQPDEP